MGQLVTNVITFVRGHGESLVNAYHVGLRKLLRTVSPEAAAQILAASEKVLGPVRGGGMN